MPSDIAGDQPMWCGILGGAREALGVTYPTEYVDQSGIIQR
ncbi:MAG TPA: hypothetical protein VGH11_12245 [Jatrophihabitans sp.]|jgi:hypothetical protein